MLKSPLTQIREERGYTRQQLGIVLRVSQPTVSRIEDGFTPIPKKIFAGLIDLCLKPEEVVKAQDDFMEGIRKELLNKEKIKI